MLQRSLPTSGLLRTLRCDLGLFVWGWSCKIVKSLPRDYHCNRHCLDHIACTLHCMHHMVHLRVRSWLLSLLHKRFLASWSSRYGASTASVLSAQGAVLCATASILKRWNKTLAKIHTITRVWQLDFSSLTRRCDHFNGFLVSWPLLAPKLTADHCAFKSRDFGAKKCPKSRELNLQWLAVIFGVKSCHKIENPSKCSPRRLCDEKSKCHTLVIIRTLAFSKCLLVFYSKVYFKMQ